MKQDPGFDGQRLAGELAQIPDCRLTFNQLLAPYTSYRIGGPTAILIAPETESALCRILKAVHRLHAPLFILGLGSNVLVSDHGWPGVTLWLGGNFSGWCYDGLSAIVKSGTRMMDFIGDAVNRGMAGLEQMAGIPGSIGGALRMNAGAFGQEIQDVTVSIDGFGQNGRRLHIPHEAIRFAYRSAPELETVVIATTRLRFSSDDPETLKKRLREILSLRKKKQPLEHPSCGSVFKRPSGYFAGALIEEAGLKGKRVGDALVSAKHAGFIVNLKHARASDVHDLIQQIEDRVWKRFGVRLEREVRLIGEF
jgi:UDP-N-acetylmuramate dehydrogenase